MASIDQVELVNKSITASEDSGSQSLSQSAKELIGYITVANYSGLTSIDVDIEHSPDGVNWFTYDSFTQATGNTSEAIFPTGAVFANVRAEVTVAGAGSADVVVRVYFDPNKR